MTTPPVDQVELRIVQRALRGEQDALRELFERYRDLAFRVARRVTGNEQDALDVMQDSFVKALNGLSALQDGGRFKPWLLRIVHNRALDVLRQRQVRVAASLDDSEGGAASFVADERGPKPQGALHASETMDKIQQALESLPPQQRSVLSLYVQGELSYGEIAEILGVPMGTVMSRIYHARQRMRELLKDVDPGEKKVRGGVQ